MKMKEFDIYGPGHWSGTLQYARKQTWRELKAKQTILVPLCLVDYKWRNRDFVNAGDYLDQLSNLTMEKLGKINPNEQCLCSLKGIDFWYLEDIDTSAPWRRGFKLKRTDSPYDNNAYEYWYKTNRADRDDHGGIRLINREGEITYNVYLEDGTWDTVRAQTVVDFIKLVW